MLFEKNGNKHKEVGVGPCRYKDVSIWCTCFLIESELLLKQSLELFKVSLTRLLLGKKGPNACSSEMKNGYKVENMLGMFCKYFLN